MEISGGQNTHICFDSCPTKMQFVNEKQREKQILVLLQVGGGGGGGARDD